MIFEQVKEVIVDQLGVNEEEVKLETRFIEDLNADSLDLFQLVTELEEKFNITVDDIEKIKTVGEVVEYINSAK